MKVDIAINVFGKPYQTAVTIFSLLEHSGKHIDKIYFTEEKEKNHNDNVDFILPWFGDRIVYYRPERYIGINRGKLLSLLDEKYRLSLRYQYAWEKSDKKYLFVTHNDCLYTGDIIGGMLERITAENCAGVGLIGQCWNCPAFLTSHCDSTKFSDFKPSYQEALSIVGNGYRRTSKKLINRKNPMPFPECRLNDFACLLNVDLLRKEVYPNGRVLPYGFFGVDIGTNWFRSLFLKGYKFINWYEGLEHAWFSPERNGHSLDSPDRVKDYFLAEEKAKDYLFKNFGDQLNSDSENNKP